MTFQALSVCRCGPAERSRPRIQITGVWLPDMGFVRNSLVKAMPVQGGIDFTLCNENITRYSDLYGSTIENGGSLIRVYISNTRTLKGPTFVVSGQYILKGGVSVGDALVAKCEYGLIRVRKVDGNVRLLNISGARDSRVGVIRPEVFLWGGWQRAIGFTPGTLVTVDAAPGCITLTAQGSASEYGDIVRFARRNKMKLITVTEKGGVTLTNFKGQCIGSAGFEPGEMVNAEYGQGVIKLQKFDPGRFGF